MHQLFDEEDYRVFIQVIDLFKENPDKYKEGEFGI